MRGSLEAGASAGETISALDGVDFEVERGELFSIIGGNGSGKSTLLKLIAGILAPTSGSLTVDGRVTALIELGAGFHPEISGRENVFIAGAVLGLSRARDPGSLRAHRRVLGARRLPRGAGQELLLRHVRAPRLRRRHPHRPGDPARRRGPRRRRRGLRSPLPAPDRGAPGGRPDGGLRQPLARAGRGDVDASALARSRARAARRRPAAGGRRLSPGGRRGREPRLSRREGGARARRGGARLAALRAERQARCCAGARAPPRSSACGCSDDDGDERYHFESGEAVTFEIERGGAPGDRRLRLRRRRFPRRAASRSGERTPASPGSRAIVSRARRESRLECPNLRLGAG